MRANKNTSSFLINDVPIEDISLFKKKHFPVFQSKTFKTR